MYLAAPQPDSNLRSRLRRPFPFRALTCENALLNTSWGAYRERPPPGEGSRAVESGAVQCSGFSWSPRRQPGTSAEVPAHVHIHWSATSNRPRTPRLTAVGKSALLRKESLPPRISYARPGLLPIRRPCGQPDKTGPNALTPNTKNALACMTRRAYAPWLGQPGCELPSASSPSVLRLGSKLSGCSGSSFVNMVQFKIR
jgi:hypothetical protein